ncbi:hypothetical protein Pan97_16240 [Bremerella volcania]|uniref:Lipocalin-like domain-containing protein n=1 Tax=Bremerella volcania TaxID=2527984 RepID=A0A518C5W0_9BACT|nr:hypothetical protein [Bremerella volcania]QDU74613.1 hypothetical protein Pan97_16240 [Bremerella volcania]
MKTKLRCWALVALTLLAGYIPSLNPVYTDQQLVFDANVLGTWVQANGQDTWEFTKRDAKSYRLVYTDKDGHQGRFVARLADLNGTLFLDLFPEQKTEDDTAGFYKFHLVPIHTIYRVKRTELKLELAAIDYKWFDKYLTDHPGAIQFATFNGRKLITASTTDVQAFVLEHQEMFTGDFSLKRR